MKAIPLISVLSLVLFFFCTSAFSQSIFYVDHDAPNNGDGTTWGTAFQRLQDAISSVTLGDEVWVAEGSYFLSGGPTATFNIPSGVKIYGGFSGIEVQRAGRDFESNITILDGQSTIYSIVTFEDSNTDTTLDGFTIQNGNANGPNQRGKSGAAIFIESTSADCSPTINNCKILNNDSDNNGGAVYIDGSNIGASASPHFENCLFQDNFSNSDGGVVYASGINGGLSNPEFTKCTFKANQSNIGGGALFMNGSGGNATGTFLKCDFDSNVANGNGGAIYTLGTNSGEANHVITNSRFYNNKGFAAGGMYNNGGNGGDCSPVITNCTFYLNEATGVPQGTGGAIYNNGSNGGTSSPEVNNCVIYGNIGLYGSQVFRNVEGTPTISFSIVDVADCTGLNNGNTGGPGAMCGSGMIYNTPPLYTNEAAGDLRLQAGSPAIDSGSDELNTETEDLDCGTRKINTIDMGAYEAPEEILPVEMSEFYAYLDDDKVTLFWVTLSEDENASFTIERSSDGRDFEELFAIPGAGNSFAALQYKVYDYNPIGGANYYRIKNTSYAGEIEYSSIRIVEFSDQKIHIYPNPVESNLTVTFGDFKEDEARFSIFNIYGKLIYQGVTQVQNDISFITLSQIGSFVPGTYILKIETPRNGSFSRRFQKIRD